MGNTSEFVLRSLLIGTGATLTMDVWAAMLRQLGIPSLDFALLGRWVGGPPRGRFVHDRIASAAPVRGERLIGWCAHYAIGNAFAAALLTVAGLEWARSPTLWPALAMGLV